MYITSKLFCLGQLDSTWLVTSYKAAAQYKDKKATKSKKGSVS